MRTCGPLVAFCASNAKLNAVIESVTTEFSSPNDVTFRDYELIGVVYPSIQFEKGNFLWNSIGRVNRCLRLTLSFFYRRLGGHDRIDLFRISRIAIGRHC